MIRFPLRMVLRPLLLLLALAWVPFAALSAVEVDWWWPIPSLVAFLPYAVVFTASVVLLALLVQARVAALVALLGLAVLVVPRLGRFTSDPQPAARGIKLVVATSNVRFGNANVPALMRLIRSQHVDVLALQEDTPYITTDLAAAGLRQLMPYGTLQDAPRARGISMYSRYPVTYVPRISGDRRSVGGILALPDGTKVHVRSTHPPPPFSQSHLPRWKATTRAIAKTVASVGVVPTIVAGDFNATLDNHPIRDLIAAGHFRDASDQAGIAWKPTWSNGTWQTLTLDHILVPPHVAVENVTIHDVAGTDHDMVVATLRLPR